MQILMTGFQPFGGMASNPSWDGLFAARQAEPALFDRIAIEQIPVTWNGARAAIAALIVERKPKLVLCFGMHGGSESSGRNLRGFYFERSAWNRDDAPIADNAGDLRQGVAIEDALELDAPLLSELDPAPWLNDLRASGFEAEVSDDPGRFVCNHLFFSALRAARTYQVEASIGFIHVPPGELNRPGSLIAQEFKEAYVTLARTALHFVDHHLPRA